MILNGNIFSSILILSFPTIVMSIVMSFIPITDGLFINNSVSTEIAGAVGFSQPFINILTSFSLGLGAAAMSIIGHANGTGNIQEVKNKSMQILITSIIFALTMLPATLIMALIAKSLVAPEISNYVWLYISLNSLYLPFLFMSSIYNAIKNSTGQPEAPLMRVIILLILKVIFNTIFLKILKWGLIGASVSTIISYIILAVWMYYDLFIKDSELKLTFKGFRFDKFFIKKLFILAIPSMISYSFVNLGYVLINLEVNAYGVRTLNAQAIASNINSLCFTLPAAIGTTITVMVSMNIAIGNIKKAKNSLYIGCLISTIISLILIIAIWPNTEFLVSLFRNEPDIVELATHALKIYNLSIIGYGIFMVVQGAFIGLGNTKLPLYFGIIRMWLIRYLFIIFTKNTLLIDSVFYGNLISNYISAVLFFICIIFATWDVRKIKKTEI